MTVPGKQLLLKRDCSRSHIIASLVTPDPKNGSGETQYIFFDGNVQ